MGFPTALFIRVCGQVGSPKFADWPDAIQKKGMALPGKRAGKEAAE